MQPIMEQSLSLLWIKLSTLSYSYSESKFIFRVSQCDCLS